MNLTKTIPLFLLTFLISSTPTLAVDVSPQPSRGLQQVRIQERQEIRQENQEDRQELRQEIKNNNQEMREENKDNRLQFRRQNAVKIANNIVLKLQKRFEYLNRIQVRLQSKIDSLKTVRNMTEAQAKLAQFNSSKYSTDLASLKAKIAEIDTAEKPNTVIPALKEVSKLVQKDLKDLHQVLVDTLKLIVKAPKITE